MNRDEQADIVVCLAKKEDDVWRRFGENALHEMPVDMNGRRIFPRLKYHFEGLEEERQYAIFLEFQQVDDERQGSPNPKWKSGDMNNLEYNKTAQKIRHKNISKSGKFWMSKGVNFDHIMLTIDPTRKDLVILQEMHKYIPVLSIYECASKFKLPRQGSKPVVVFRVDYTEFIAVTKHQNEAAIALKSEYNRVLRENRMNNNRDRQKFLNQARLVIEASKGLPATSVPAPIKILPRPHFEHNMPTNYPYHPPVQTTNNNKRSHNFAVPEDSSQPKRQRLDVPTARGLPTGAVLHPSNMIPPHQFQPNRFQLMNNSYHAQPQAAYMNWNQFAVPPNGSHVGLQQGSGGMRGLPADARVPTMLPPHFTPYGFMSPNYPWYPQQQAANNNRNQFIPPSGGSNIVLRQTQQEVFNAPATIGLPTGGVPPNPTVRSLNHFTPNTMIPANNSYHPRLVAANNQQSLSVLPSKASQVVVPQAKREQFKVSSIKELPAVGVPRIPTVHPPHQVTLVNIARHPQLEVANNNQGRSVFPPNSKIAVPQATRKEIEVPSSSSTLPPQSTPSTSTPADHSSERVLEGMDIELILLAPPNNNLSMEFLKLAWLNALILFEVRWPPGTSIDGLVEAYSSLAPEKNTDLKP